MSISKTTAIIATVALLGLGVTFYQSSEARRARGKLAAGAERLNDLRAKLAELQRHLTAAEQNAKAAAQDKAALLQTLQSTAAVKAEADVPLTQDVVQARYAHAQELVGSGQFADALKEFLWCFDVGMPRFRGSFNTVRLVGLADDIGKLGQQYPTALDALRLRRDQAGLRILAGAEDAYVVADFSSLNRVLQEEGHTVEIYDQLPADDRQRSTLAYYAYASLVATQRYADALEGRPYLLMSAMFQGGPDPTMANAMPPAALQRIHDGLITRTAQDIQVLAGAGDLAHARALAGRLLDYDGSDETQALLRQHLERAGHPELLATPAKP